MTRRDSRTVSMRAEVLVGSRLSRVGMVDLGRRWPSRKTPSMSISQRLSRKRACQKLNLCHASWQTHKGYTSSGANAGARSPPSVGV